MEKKRDPDQLAIDAMRYMIWHHSHTFVASRMGRAIPYRVSFEEIPRTSSSNQVAYEG